MKNNENEVKRVINYFTNLDTLEMTDWDHYNFLSNINILVNAYNKAIKKSNTLMEILEINDPCSYCLVYDSCDSRFFPCDFILDESLFEESDD